MRGPCGSLGALCLVSAARGGVETLLLNDISAARGRIETLLLNDIDEVEFVEPEEEQQLLDSLRTCGRCAPGAGVHGASADGFLRIGEGGDGGYVMCGTALRNTSLAFSVGLTGDDWWGQNVSNLLSIPVHEFDCQSKRPATADERAHFHSVCVDSTFRPPEAHSEEIRSRTAATEAGSWLARVKQVTRSILEYTPLAALAREYEPIEVLVESTLGRHGGAVDEKQPVPQYDTNLLLKMDVGGAEWGVLYSADADFFRRFRQIVIKFHRLDEPKHYRVYAHCLKKLLQHFVIVHTHGDNSAGTVAVSLPGHGHNFTLAANMAVTLVRQDLAQEVPCSSGKHVAADRADVPGKPDPDPVLPDTEVPKPSPAPSHARAKDGKEHVKSEKDGPVHALKSDGKKTKHEKLRKTKGALVQTKAVAKAEATAEEKQLDARWAAPAAPASLLTFAPWRGSGTSMATLAQRWQQRQADAKAKEDKEEAAAREAANSGLAAVTVDPFTQLRSAPSLDASPLDFGLSADVHVPVTDLELRPQDYAPSELEAPPVQDFPEPDMGEGLEADPSLTADSAAGSDF